MSHVRRITRPGKRRTQLAAGKSITLPLATGQRAILIGLQKAVQTLTLPTYRIFCLSELFVLMAKWIQITTQTWLVVELSGSAWALGLLTTLHLLPTLLFTLVGGMIADRLPKRNFLKLTQGIMGVQALVFGVLVVTNSVQLWHIYALVGIQGLVSALDGPARETFAVELAGKENSTHAIGLYSVVFNGSRVIGAAGAGALIASLGTAPPLFLSAALWLVGIGGLSLIKGVPISAPKPDTPAMEQAEEVTVRAGLHYVWHTPQVLFIVIVIAAIGTFGYNFQVTVPLLAEFVLHSDATGLGFLSAAFGIGALVAALVTTISTTLTPRRLISAASAFSLLLAVTALSHHFWLSSLLLSSLGFTGMLVANSANALLQRMVPANLRGRVMALYMLLFGGTTAFAASAIGAASTVVGVPTTIFLCAVFCALGVCGAFVYQRLFISSN